MRTQFGLQESLNQVNIPGTEPLKIQQQHEALQGINHAVRSLNSEFERTLMFANNQQVKHETEMNEKNSIIDGQNDKIRILMQQVEDLRLA